jgi:hypothetical protein
MDARRRKEILGQWGVREGTARDRAQGRALEADLAGAAVAGRPFQLRRRHFRPAVDSYITSLGGPLPYMLRLREIEKLTEAAEEELRVLWHALAEECAGDGAAFALRWLDVAKRWDFYEVNRLIEIHNRWYPTEARLPMDVRRRDYALVGGRPYTRSPLDAAWVLERLPAELGAALAAVS